MTLTPQINYLFGETRRANGKLYIPKIGTEEGKLHSYNGSLDSLAIGTPTPGYKWASSLPTQIYKIFSTTSSGTGEFVRTVGDKRYELKDHLGNVRVVINDIKQLNDVDNDHLLSAGDILLPTVLQYYDYYPFGMIMPGSSQSAGGGYRYGFNGMEKDDEVKGSGISLDFGARIYDSRLGQFLSLDPLSGQFPNESNYSSAGNSPIGMIDDEGKKKTYYITRIDTKGNTTQLKVVEKYNIRQFTTETRKNYGLPGTGYTMWSFTESETKTYDLKQNITINERTGKITYGKVELAGERSNVAASRFIEDNMEELSAKLGEWDDDVNGGGGIVFTSEIGMGLETREGYKADSKSENIDLLMSVLSAASAASSNKAASAFIQGMQDAVNAISIGNDVLDQFNPSTGLQKEKQVTCGACRGDTIPESKKGQHGGPFKPVD